MLPQWSTIRKKLKETFFFPQDLDDIVAAALIFYGEKKMLDNSPLPLSLEKENDPRLLTSPLKFPGKLAIDVINNRLFISDSNHNRIVGSLSLSLFHTYIQFRYSFSTAKTKVPTANQKLHLGFHFLLWQQIYIAKR